MWLVYMSFNKHGPETILAYRVAREDEIKANDSDSIVQISIGSDFGFPMTPTRGDGGTSAFEAVIVDRVGSH
jgi:hypothetical protein